MTISYRSGDAHGATVWAQAASLQARHQPIVNQLQRYPAIATLNTSSQYAPRAFKFNALRCNRGIDAYLERRLFRQWRQRGS
jgi:hypothetical protein